MDIELSKQESAAIRQALDTYCSDLRMEIVDTDNPAFRRGLGTGARRGPPHGGPDPDPQAD